MTLKDALRISSSVSLIHSVFQMPIGGVGHHLNRPCLESYCYYGNTFTYSSRQYKCNVKIHYKTRHVDNSYNYLQLE